MLDPLHGYILLAENLLATPTRFATSFNFGPSEKDAWPVDRIATALVGMWGNGAASTKDAVPGPHDTHFLRLDASRARSELDWQPRLKIDAALAWTVEWYRACQADHNMRDETLAQVARFDELPYVKQAGDSTTMRFP